MWIRPDLSSVPAGLDSSSTTAPLASPEDTSIDPLYALDPFALLLDARQQLLTIAEAIRAREPDRVAIALGAVVAQDDALRAIVNGEAGADPGDAGDATIEEAYAARAALLEAMGAAGLSLDAEVAVPWAGTDTWHVHIIGLAMFEGAQAHALREGDPVPAPRNSP